MPHLVERGGNIVNVSSIAGLRAYPGQCAKASFLIIAKTTFEIVAQLDTLIFLFHF
jgi:NADP-dependent 3-hydroxy acid dehydrogenase YdfG